jgi:hypothetical protein
VLARRLLIVLAVLVGLTALASGVAPREPVVRDGGSASPRPPAPTRAPGVLERTLDAGETGQRVVARIGQTVVITVEGATLDTVRLAEYGDETVEPASPARFELLADVPGSYAIDLLEADRRIGTLEVRRAPGQPDAGDSGGAAA